MILSDNAITAIGIVVVISVAITYFGRMWLENSWTKYNDWYDINGYGKLRINHTRMITSESWKQMQQQCSTIDEI